MMERVLVLPIAVLGGGILFGLVFGLPMAFTMGSSAMITALLFLDPRTLLISVTSTYGAMRMLIMIAMPLFVFMACIMEKSGVADDLYNAMHQWLGPAKGGLAIATVIITTLIAALSGVTTTGVVTMGMIALPIMLKRGYNKTMAIGPIMAGGVLGILIPPSISFIIFGMLTQTSIGKLFAAGIIPGLLLSSLYISYIGIRCYLRPELGPPVPKEERVTTKQKIILSKGLILPILLVLGVLGSIFGGIASPTEASAVGAFGAILCAAIHRKLNWKLVRDACYRTLTVNGMCMWIVFGAFSFSAVFSILGGQAIIKSFILGLEVDPFFVILMMMISYFIMGCFLDEITIMLLTIPLYFPVMLSLGYDPVWFGALFIVNMQMAYLTPPFGFALFYMRGIAPPGVTIMDIYRSVVPFVCLQWIGLLSVLFFPQLALWLPSVVFGLK